MPGVYPKDNNGFFQAVGGIGIKATTPFASVIGRSYYKNNEYLKCKVSAYSDSTALLSFFGGPSDEGKSHVGFYELTPLNNPSMTILASHDSIVISNIKNALDQNQYDSGPDLLGGFMMSYNTKPETGKESGD